MDATQPDIQLISNLVVTNENGEVLFVRYDRDDDRWWLPGGDLVPYQHPDDRAKEALDAVPGLEWSDLRMTFVESFRGRRGWHVMFDYHARARSAPRTDETQSWHAPTAMPRTMHGRFEADTIRRVLEAVTATA